MTSIAAPAVHRPFVKTVPINSSSRDYTTDEGVRISLPCYIDASTQIRKSLLNAVRTACFEPSTTEASRSVSGITVENSSSRQGEIESQLGMSVDVLRTVLFSRGGIAADLFFKLQAIANEEYVTDKDLTACFKQRQVQLKDCKANAITD